MQNPENTLEES